MATAELDRRAATFGELDDLVLHLKGLVLVRSMREERGAGDDELAMYGAEIDRVRDRLANIVKTGGLERAA
jgi:hypothetical protein